MWYLLLSRAVVVGVALLIPTSVRLTDGAPQPLQELPNALGMDVSFTSVSAVDGLLQPVWDYVSGLELPNTLGMDANFTSAFAIDGLLQPVWDCVTGLELPNTPGMDANFNSCIRC